MFYLLTVFSPSIYGFSDQIQQSPPWFEAISSESVTNITTMKTLRVDASQIKAVRVVELCTSLDTEKFCQEIFRHHKLA